MNDPIYRKHTVTWINAALVLCTVIIVGMIALLFNQRAASSALREIESGKWDRMLLSADVGMWKWNVSKGEIYWDDTFRRIFGMEDKTVTPTYAIFAERLDPADAGWVTELIQRTFKDHTSYRAVYRLKTGGYIRAHGKVIIMPDGSLMFAGVCMPAEASEYTGKPVVVILSNPSFPNL